MSDPAPQDRTVEEILTKMVENTIIVITSDLPSLLQTEEAAHYRRVHKDQILQNLPEAAQAITNKIKEAELRGRIDTAEHLHRNQGADLPKRDYDNDTDEYICTTYLPQLTNQYKGES